MTTTEYLRQQATWVKAADVKKGDKFLIFVGYDQSYVYLFGKSYSWLEHTKFIGYTLEIHECFFECNSLVPLKVTDKEFLYGDCIWFPFCCLIKIPENEK